MVGSCAFCHQWVTGRCARITHPRGPYLLPLSLLTRLLTACCSDILQASCRFNTQATHKRILQPNMASHSRRRQQLDRVANAYVRPPPDIGDKMLNIICPGVSNVRKGRSNAREETHVNPVRCAVPIVPLNVQRKRCLYPRGTGLSHCSGLYMPLANSVPF